MNISGFLKKYAWLNIGLAFSLVVVMVILHKQGINTGQHVMICIVVAGFFLGALGFEAKDIDDTHEATTSMLQESKEDDSDNGRVRASQITNPIVSYAIGHAIIFVFVLGEAIASTILIPVLGAILAGLTFVVYLPWLAWRVLKLVRSPAKELQYFDKFTKK